MRPHLKRRMAVGALAVTMAGGIGPGASAPGRRASPPHPAPIPQAPLPPGTDTTSWRVLPSSTFDSSDRIDVIVPVDSLEVRTVDASPAQLHAIRKHMMEDVLHADRHPQIRFVSKSVTPTDDGVRVEGALTLADSTRSIQVEAHLELRGDTLEAAGTLPLRQTDYGVEPCSFGFGAIKVADRLDLRFDVLAVRAGTGSGGT